MYCTVSCSTKAPLLLSDSLCLSLSGILLFCASLNLSPSFLFTVQFYYSTIALGTGPLVAVVWPNSVPLGYRAETFRAFRHKRTVVIIMDVAEDLAMPKWTRPRFCVLLWYSCTVQYRTLEQLEMVRNEQKLISCSFPSLNNHNEQISRSRDSLRYSSPACPALP